MDPSRRLASIGLDRLPQELFPGVTFGERARLLPTSNRCMISKTDVAQLDELMEELAKPGETQCELLREHIESARSSLLGGMNEEYILNLRLASQAINCIADSVRKNRVSETILQLLHASK